MNSTIYELAKYDYMYDETFYYQFKKDDTSVARIKSLLRQCLSYDAYFEESNKKGNIKAIHLLKTVRDIDSLIKVLEITDYELKEKELL